MSLQTLWAALTIRAPDRAPEGHGRFAGTVETADYGAGSNSPRTTGRSFGLSALAIVRSASSCPSCSSLSKSRLCGRDRAEMGDRLRRPAMRSVQDGVRRPYAGRWRGLFIPHDLGEGCNSGRAVRPRQLDYVVEFAGPSARIAALTPLKWSSAWSHLLSLAVLSGSPRCFSGHGNWCFMTLKAGRVERRALRRCRPSPSARSLSMQPILHCCDGVTPAR